MQVCIKTAQQKEGTPLSWMSTGEMKQNIKLRGRAECAKTKTKHKKKKAVKCKRISREDKKNPLHIYARHKKGMMK